MKLIFILFSLIALKTCDTSETGETHQDTLEGSFLITKVLDSDVTNFKLTIDFNNQTKQVSGFSGCNRFFGSYTLSENILSIGPLASTKMMCQGETNTIESKLLDQLSNVNSFSINGSTLILKMNDNELITAITK